MMPGADFGALPVWGHQPSSPADQPQAARKLPNFSASLAFLAWLPAQAVLHCNI